MSQPLAEAPIYRGIEGVAGRHPVGAALTLGRKNERGHVDPSTTNRFWLALPVEGPNKIRPLHPEFAAFNDAAPSHRQVIRGNLVHATEKEAWQWHRKAMVLPDWPAHPDRVPACRGDGKRATRYDPEGRLGAVTETGFREIECLNRQCEFAGKDGPCNAWGRLYFRIRWRKEDALPAPLVMWENNSINTTENVVGFFSHVREQAAGLGLSQYSLYGLPFTLTLARKTKPSEKRNFPVVYLSPDGDLISFFLHQKEQLRQLGASPELALLPAGDVDAAEVYADHATITPGHVRKPAVIQGELVPEESEVELADGPSLDERWQVLVRKADALGLSAARVHDAVNALGGDYPDMGPEMDAKIEEKLQTMARSKR